MNRFESLRRVDVNDFLFTEEETPDLLSRRALGLILWSYEFRESELKQRRELTETVHREAMALLQKAESLASTLDKEISVTDEVKQNRLRAVLNCLLDSRLRLERGIVRFSNRRLTSAEPRMPAPQTVSASEPPPPAGRKRSVSRSIVVSLLIFVLVGGAFYFMRQQFSGFMSATANVGDIDVRTLPNREHFVSA